MESIRELFRIGNGPSSSPSMGPRLAADLVLSRHPNGVMFETPDDAGHSRSSWKVYSVGGGAIREHDTEDRTPRAVHSSEFSMLSDGAHHISFDEVIEAMKKTGADLHEAYRETSIGGLAALPSSPPSLVGNECA